MLNNEEKDISQKSHEKTSLSIILSSVYALGVVAFILALFYFPVDFSIKQGGDPLIGEATKYNVSIDKRVSFFYKMIFLGTVLWLVITWFFTKVYKNVFRSTENYSTGLYYVIPLIVCAFLHVSGVELKQTMHLLFGTFVLGLVYYAALAKNTLIVSHDVPFERFFELGFLLNMVGYFFFGHISGVENWATIFFLLLVVILIIAINGLRFQKNTLRLLSFVSAGIPFLIFIAIEWHVFSLEYELYLLGYKKGFLILFGSWIVFAVFALKKLPRLTEKYGVVLFRSALIFGFCLMVYYQPVLNAIAESFELANPANSLLRISRFGEIPMLDFMSSHMIYEQWYGVLHQSIFGFKSSLDFMAYSFLNQFIFLLFVYWFLKRVGFKSHAAMLFIFLFPVVQGIFFVHVFYAFFVYFAIQRLASNGSALNYFLVATTIFLLLVWRVDTGVAALFTTVAFLPLYWWIVKPSFRFSEFIKGIGFFLLFILSLLLVALALRSGDHIWQNFLSALHYVKGSQAHGYSTITNTSHQQFYVFHILFVALAVVLSVFAVYKIKTRQFNRLATSQSTYLFVSIFSFILFLANAQRGLVRHGFAENNELFFAGTFYLGLAFFILDYFRQKPNTLKFAVFYTVLFFSFIITKFFPFAPETLPSNSLLVSERLKNLNTELSKNVYTGRVRNHQEFIMGYCGDLKSYFDENLKHNQSFIDFSNTPMLYFYCERRVPGYFNQNLQNTIDDYLQRELIAAYKKNDLPFVVYSSYPPNWYDMTDGVLNTVRYYLVAEYIFEHYQPIGVLNNKSVFGKKTATFPEITAKDTIISNPVIADLGFLPGWQGNAFTKKHVAKQNFAVLLTKTTFSNKMQEQRIFLDDVVVQNNHVELLLKVDGQNQEPLLDNHFVFYVEDELGELKHEVRLYRDDGNFEYYAIRMSINYYWHNKTPLVLIFPNLVGIESISIIKHNPIEH
jgi:hypothetical protein